MTAEVAQLPRPTTRNDLRATVARDLLLEALSWAAQAVRARPASPALAGVHLTAFAGGLVLTGFDYELCASQTILAPGSSGSALVPCARLRAVVRTLPKGGQVQMRVTNDGRALTLSTSGPAGTATFELPLLNINDWPDTPSAFTGARMTVDGPSLAHLTRTAVATGADDTLPVLTGTRLEPTDSGVAAVCSDRYRLAQADASMTWTLGEMLVPTSALRRAGTRFARDRDVVLARSDHRDDGWLSITSADRCLQTRLLAGTFPAWRKLLPTGSSTSVTVDRDALAAAVEQAGVVGDRFSPVRLDVTDTLTVHGGPTGKDRGDDSAAATVHVAEAAITGQSLTAAFNLRFLRQGLASLPPGPVTFAAAGAALKPIVLTSPELPGYLYLLMPVRLAS